MGDCYSEGAGEMEEPMIERRDRTYAEARAEVAAAWERVRETEMPIAWLMGLSAGIGAPQLAKQVRSLPEADKQRAEDLATLCEGFAVGVLPLSLLEERQVARPFVEALIADLNKFLDRTPATVGDVAARLNEAQTRREERQAILFARRQAELYRDEGKNDAADRIERMTRWGWSRLLSPFRYR